MRSFSPSSQTGIARAESLGDFVFPCSFAQERLWLVTQLAPESPLYNIAFAVWITGQLNDAALERSLHELVRRHEALRTTFGVSQGGPVQIVHEVGDFALSRVNLSELAELNCETRARQIAQQEGRRAFDVRKGPLFRVTLVHLGEGENLLLVVMHHLISDGWSMGIIVSELSQLYERALAKDLRRLPEPDLQYADYAVWQRHYVMEQVLVEQLGYWKTQLAGLEPLSLPADFPNHGERGHDGGIVHKTIDREVANGLRQLAQSEQATTFMVLLAAFVVLLARYSGVSDIAVGTPVANRTRSETERLIGFFVNTIVLRIDVKWELSFRDLLRQARRLTIQAQNNQDVPFERLVQELNPERALGRNPLFEVMFSIDNIPLPSLRTSGLRIHAEPIALHTAKFDLNVSVETKSADFEISLEYSVDLYEEETAERMLAHWSRLLAAVAQDPDAVLGDLPLLSQNEQRQIVEVWGRSERDSSPRCCAHELFEETALKKPGKIAIELEGKQLTYQELNERANQLAHYLRELGIGPESKVGLLIRRSLDMVVALLGILKSGAAYVPLDPALPTERLLLMLAETAPVLVSQTDLVAGLSLERRRSLCMDRDWEEIAKRSRDNPVSGVLPANAAYVMYTSGSTGQPKGVVMCHEAIFNLLTWQRQQVRLSGKTLQFASLSFDVSFQEIFTCFREGETLVIIPRDVWDPAALLDCLATANVQTAFLPYAALHDLAVVAAERNIAPQSLDNVITAGERLQITPAIRSFFGRLPHSILHNHYGPTETHVATSYVLPAHHETLWPEYPQIGRPIANAATYVLDPRLAPVPVGIDGELYIGGAILARGYLNRPDLTAERFLPDPFDGSRGARIYRTGDLVRWQANGELAFLGRRDSQIKVRGFRVELGEIEAVLREHPVVESAVVIARSANTGDVELIAYVVAKPGKSSEPVLKTHIRTKLPAYMAVHRYVFLTEMPLNANGKIDRKALSSPTLNGYAEGQNLPPRTATEQILAELWEEVLSVRGVGPHDDFFRLGGHSLLATKLLSRMHAVFSVEFPIRRLFEGPTLEQMAAVIEQVKTQGTTQPAEAPLQKSLKRSHIPLSFAQQSLWFLDQLAPGTGRYNIGSAFLLSGVLKERTFEKVLQAIIDRHETLRTCFEMLDDEPVQRIQNVGHFTLERAQLGPNADASWERMSDWARNFIARPFDLGRAPLFRVGLWKLNVDQQVVAIVMHHTICDGWSVAIFIQEFMSLYEAFESGVPSSLPELNIQYADYAIWQRETMQSKTLPEELAYWKKQLNNLDPLLLPTDRPRSRDATFRGRNLRQRMPRELNESLAQISRAGGATSFIVLLSALNVLLYRYSGQQDCGVGTPIANRTHPEMEPLIGCFINTLVLRTRVKPAEPFNVFLAQVRNVCVDAFMHPHLPFEKLVGELRPTRESVLNPLVQVMFVLQNVPMRALKVAGLDLREIEIASETLKCELLISLRDADGALECNVEYSDELWDPLTIEQFVRHWTVLLEGIVSDPGTAVIGLPLLTAQEHSQLLETCRDRDGAAKKTGVCIPQLFEEQVKRMPHAAAVMFEEAEISYGELNRRANHLAHYLKRLGVSPEVRVGLCMERGAEIVIGMLGILKAGGTYVPLDPSYPQERLRFIADDSGLGIVVTHTTAQPKELPSHVKIVRIDEEWDLIARERHDNPICTSSPANAAYLIYTSGSTGRPKGVVVCHWNVVRLFLSTRQCFGFHEKDVWTLFHSCAFDFSVWEIWGALLHGGLLIVVPYWVSRSPEAMGQLLRERRVTVLNQTPSAFRQLSQAEADDAFDAGALSLRLVIFGGELLEMASLRPWLARHGDDKPRLVNMYGITETTVHVTHQRITMEMAQQNASVIGRRIGDLQLFVLDQALQMAPIGVVGELCVGGDGLARGYWRQPDLTAEKFVPNPFSGVQGARLYRSGDLGRYRRDGTVEYLGRNDQQVKIRGHRIELGEIEIALQRHEAVKHAVVICNDDTAKRLLAYVVYHERSRRPELGALRSYLLEMMPEYMVPGLFVPIDQVPLTENGKLDRKALPKPRLGEEATRKYVKPRNKTEEALCDIWHQVLGVDRVGIEDNFFALGGDSILSIKVVAQAKKLGVRITLQQLFEHQTIAALARVAGVDESSKHAFPALAPYSLLSSEDRAQLPADVEDAYPLSKLQLGMLFHSYYAPEDSLYHNVSSFHLQLPLDVDLLQRAVEETVSRHPILRTSFHLTDYSQPLQLVHRDAEIGIRVSDVSNLEDAAQEREAQRSIEYERQRMFDVTKPGLLRFQVHKRSEERFQFTVTDHHAILDGWSIALLLTELFTAYSAFLVDRPWVPNSLTGNFGDFIALESEAVRSPEIRAFWEDRLKDTMPSQLPWLGGTGIVGRESIAFQIDAEVGLGLSALANRLGLPLKSLLLAGHLRVMQLLGGRQDQITTGLVSNGRVESSDGERVLGLFLNTLPLCVRLEGGRWTDLVRQAADAERQILPHRRFPLTELQAMRGGVSLCQVAFNFTHFHLYRELEKSKLKVLDVASFGRTDFSLLIDFSVDVFVSEIHARLEFDRALIARERGELIATYYRHALQAMARNPERHYESQSLLTDQERRQLLVAWNQTVGQCPQKSIADLFVEQVRKSPEAVALVHERQQLSYQEVNRRANQVSHYLRRLGVRADVLVGLCMDRTPEMVIWILGILKAGGAYVPLDPSYPADRLYYILEDAELKVLVVGKGLEGVMKPKAPLTVVELEHEWHKVLQETTENLQCSISPENLAYVMYTSGSTGKPKGIAIRQQAVVRLVKNNNYAELGPEEVMLLMSPASFDASTFELWGSLLNGGKLVVCSTRVPSPEELAQLLQQESVTTLWLSAGMFHTMIDEQLDSLMKLRQVVAGGDVLSPAHVERFLTPGGMKRRLINGYGPTENTTFTCCHGLDVYRADGRSVAVGKPICATQVYVLDRWLDCVPVGVVGELYIGGDGLARGYIGRPDLTAESFVPHPFSRVGGERLYRSGDLCRWREGGELEFIGRIDQQVKIRGHRVELGEIENVLSEHEQVGSVAVVADDQPGRGNRLVAYIVPRSHEALRPSELRTHLGRRVPEYMLPAVFVVLERLPQTPNGKVDRKALPKAEARSHEVEEKYIAARTATQEILCGIWCQVLGVERVGIEDDFFELGGDSLVAMQLVSRVRKAFSVELLLRDFFAKPTVKDSAEAIDRKRGGGARPAASEIRRVDRGLPIALSPAQQRLWFLDLLQPGSSAYNIALGVKMYGSLNRKGLRCAIQEIVRRHEVLRTRFPKKDGEGVQEVERDMELTVEEINLESLTEAQKESFVMRHAREEAETPFELNRGPLVRTKLLQLDDRKHVLLFTLHHIVSDGWSLGIVVREFLTLYRAYCEGKPSPLKELSVQYADYAAWQQEWLRGDALDAHMQYWRVQLAGLEPLRLPCDHHIAPGTALRATSLPLSWPGSLSDQLKTFSRQEGVTLFILLLAAFKLALGHWTRQTDIVVGTDVANRNRAEIEGNVGFFVNQLLLRTRLDLGSTFRDYLYQVREVSLNAFDHQELPFERAVQIVNPDRELDRAPLVAAKFVLQNSGMERLALDDLELEVMDMPIAVAKFELLVNLRDIEGELLGNIEYASDLFEATTIAGFAEEFCHVTQQIAVNPNDKIATIYAELDSHMDCWRQELDHELKAQLQNALLRKQRRNVAQSS